MTVRNDTSMQPTLQPAFTLVELLVVIAIVGVLVALLLPAVQSAREAARRVQCQNNLRQIGLAVLNVHDATKEFPKGIYAHPNRGHQFEEDGLGWLTKCLPFIEEAAVYDQIASSTIPQVTNPWNPGIFSHAYSASMLIPGGDAIISVLLCPSVNLPSHAPPLDWGGTPYLSLNTGYATAHYKGSRGFCDYGILMRPAEALRSHPTGCWMEVNGQQVSVPKIPFRRVRIQDVKDGTTKTILAGESAYYLKQDEPKWPIWMGAALFDEATLFKTEPIINCNIRSRNFPLSQQEIDNAAEPSDDCALSWHVGGAYFVFCDASVRFIQDTIELRTYQKLGDRRDGEYLDNLFE